jgi:methylated-DNA-protein-cysteine methyltransferase-like protein
MKRNTVYTCIYNTIKYIPSGKVATYGQIARLARLAGGVRQVGYALHQLPHGSDIPWDRVVNFKGRISLHPDRSSGSLQRALLESEGIVFNANDSINLEQYQWKK